MIMKATVDDIKDVLNINQSFVPMVSSVDREWMLKYLDQAAYFRVFKSDGVVEAFLIAMLPQTVYPSVNFRWFKERYRSFLYIDRVAVQASSHGRGLGKALYNDLFTFAQGQADLITCEVNIRPRNDVSLGFHNSLGFQEVGQQDTSGGELRVSMLAKPTGYLDAL